MASVRLPNENGTIMYTGNALTGGSDTWVKIELEILNCGSTPAWIFRQWVTLEFSYKVLSSATKHVYPDIELLKGIDGASRDGKVAMVNHEIIPLTKEGGAYRWSTEVHETGIATADNRLSAYIYGVVQYRDPFSALRETYFGYALQNGELVRIPSDAYNRHT